MNYEKIISFAKEAKVDYAHNFDHVLRVFHSAMKIAEGHPEADTEVLRTAVLLHDIGRSDLTAAHAKKGAVMAKEWLIQTDTAMSSPERLPASFPPTRTRTRRGMPASRRDPLGCRQAGDDGRHRRSAGHALLRGSGTAHQGGIAFRRSDSINPRDLIEQYAEDMDIASAAFTRRKPWNWRRNASRSDMKC